MELSKNEEIILTTNAIANATNAIKLQSLPLDASSLSLLLPLVDSTFKISMSPLSNQNEQLQINQRESFKSRNSVIDGRNHRDDISLSIRKVKRDFRANSKRKHVNDDSILSINTTCKRDSNENQNNMSVPMSKQVLLIPEKVLDLKSNNEAICYEASKWFRTILSIEKEPPIDLVINSGIIPRLIHLISQNQYHNIQFEAAWALTNILTSDKTEHIKIIVDHGAISIFVQMLSSNSSDIREQAVWALGNIVGESYKYRNMVLEAGALPLILKEAYSTQKLSYIKNIIWIISNFCRGKPSPDFNIISPVLPLIISVIQNATDEELLVDSIWALSYFSDGKGLKIEGIMNSHVLSQIVKYLYFQNLPFLIPTLRIFGNIATGNNNQTQYIINIGFLQATLHLFDNNRKSIIKELCWIISNIAAGTESQINSIIQSNFIPPLINILKYGEMDIKEEAAWALSNICGHKLFDQVQYLVSQGCIQGFCDQLLENDIKLVKVVLDGLNYILETGSNKYTNLSENIYARLINEYGGFEKIEQLQLHPNSDIYEKARKIIEKYFDIEGNFDEISFGNTPIINDKTNMYQFISNIKMM